MVADAARYPLSLLAGALWLLQAFLVSAQLYQERSYVYDYDTLPG
jgi:hypothetical protein